MSIIAHASGEADAPEDPVAPFRLVRPDSVDAPILVTSPHSGSHYPQSLLRMIRVPLIDLRRTEDAFVDELVAIDGKLQS